MIADEKLHQILLNLLSNAVKFTEAGRVEIRVCASAEQISFVVSDTGVGIDARDLPGVFDQFRQADGSTTRRHDGTGLGLAIARRLAELLGGELTARSVLGEGSTFALTLPIRCLDGLGPANEPPLPGPTPARSPTRPVLVVDDEPGARSLIRGVLVRNGCEVVEASNGEEALRLARQLQPCAITLDVLMPDMDGWEILQRLKAAAETAAIPVLIASVSDGQATGFALGAAGYVAKPIQKACLLREIRRTLGQRVPRRVLVVDDSPVDRRFLAGLLEELNCRVREAADGREALALIADQRPDVVCLDLVMPELDGFDVLARIRADPATRDLPVIVVTAKDLTQDERDRLALSVERVMTKRRDGQPELAGELARALEETVPSPGSTGRAVLVVEDNEIAALQIRAALEAHRYAVTVASGGAGALAAVRVAVPDAIVLDLMMPDVDGFEVFSQLRSRPATRHTPVLVLTAKELTAEDRARLVYNNVSQLVQKGSVDRDQLVACVAGLFSHTEPKELLARPVADRRPPEAQADGGPAAPGTVLVVEDHPDNLLTLGLMLDKAGCPYVSAGNGREAVRVARATRPALILMDVQLPGMSGLEATRALKGDPDTAGIPIVAVTARAMEGEREAILATGCDDYISEPVAPEALSAILRRWLG